jgi:hypothetical protein
MQAAVIMRVGGLQLRRKILALHPNHSNGVVKFTLGSG